VGPKGGAVPQPSWQFLCAQKMPQTVRACRRCYSRVLMLTKMQARGFPDTGHRVGQSAALYEAQRRTEPRGWGGVDPRGARQTG